MAHPAALALSGYTCISAGTPPNIFVISANAASDEVGSAAPAVPAAKIDPHTATVTKMDMAKDCCIRLAMLLVVIITSSHLGVEEATIPPRSRLLSITDVHKWCRGALTPFQVNPQPCVVPHRIELQHQQRDSTRVLRRLIEITVYHSWRGNIGYRPPTISLYWREE